MSASDEDLQRRKSVLLLEQFIEFGTRQGLLGPGGLSYAHEEDGSVSVVVPAGRFHFVPHSVAALTPIILSVWKNNGAKPLLRANSGLRWDPATKAWSFYGRRGTEEACMVLWQVLEAAAKRVRWKIPKVRADQREP